MRGRTTQKRPTLTPHEQAQLRAMQQNPLLSSKVQRRAALVLYIAGGMSITDTADMVNMSRRHVYAWLAVFEAHGAVGLHGYVRLRGVRR
jgi:hypothetical protein